MFIIGVAQRERKCYKAQDTLGYIFGTAHFCISGTSEDVCYACSCKVEAKWNVFIFCFSSPQAAPWPQGTVGQQEGLGWEWEVGRTPEEVPDQRVGEAGDKRAAEAGIKIPCDKCLSVCPEQAACTSRLPHRLCWTLLVTGMAKQQMLGVNPRFLWVCKVGCSHSQILHKLSLCANHKECPNCQGVFQLLEMILALSAPLNP